MNFYNLDRVISYFLILFTAIVLVYVASYSDVHYEGSESINHYLFSASLFDHPEVGLDNWGKPLFVLLSSPFTYFGEKGVMIFNCLIMLLSAYFSFKVCKELDVKWSFPVILLVVFSPVYYKFSQSCLTEPLFGFVAIFSAYLFLKRYYLWATLVISFIVFARTEGMLFLPLYGIALVIREKYKVLPFLLVGFLTYSISAWVMGKGFLLFFTSYPYSSVVDFYGTGPFWHWFTNHEYIIGNPFSVLIMISFVLVIASFFLKTYKNVLNLSIPLFIIGLVMAYFSTNLKYTAIVALAFIYVILKDLKLKNLVFLGLIVFPTCIYIFGHSYLWYKGLSASVGLFRIVGGVIPLMAVIAVVGLDYIVKYFEGFPYSKYISLAGMVGISFWIVSSFYHEKDSVVLIQPSEMEKTIANSIDWIKENDLDKNTLIIYQAQFFLEFESKKFDPENSNIKEGLYFIRNREKPHEGLETDDILVWDGKASPNEGGLPIEKIDTTYFEFLAEFRPEHEFDVHMAGKYYIKIFRRK